MRVTRAGRWLTGAAVSALCVVGAAPAAYAADPGATSSAPQGGGSPPPGNTTISAAVRYDVRHNGSGTGLSPVVPADASWTPPVCWSQPKYSAAQYKAWMLGPENTGTGPGSDQIAKAIAARTDFHDGQKGAWWFRTYDVSQMYGQASPDQLAGCVAIPGQQWVKQGAPRPPVAISPGILSGLAYKAMRLPSPPVRLSPVAAKQVVNFPTYVKFGAPLGRVWVTAAFDSLGVDIAATTVATPVALRIDAGRRTPTRGSVRTP